MPTLRQERVVETLEDPTIKTKTQALIAAGYSPSTALGQAARVSRAVGTQRVREQRRDKRADSARGFAAISAVALETASEDIKALHPADRLGVAVKFAELAHTVGDNVQQTGDGDAWKRLRRTAMRRAYRAGFRAALEGRDPLHLVDSQQQPATCEPHNTPQQQLTSE